MGLFYALFPLFNHFLWQPFGLAFGALSDARWGDPEDWPHPIVWFGKVIALYERKANEAHRSPRTLRFLGAVMAITFPLLTFLLSGLLLSGLVVLYFFVVTNLSDVCGGSFVIVFLFLVITSGVALPVFYCLAGRTLRREVGLVFEAVDRSLDEGRIQVARIVGRDTAQLSVQEVKLAALETLAENLNDGVIAPLFYFLIGLILSVAMSLLSIFSSSEEAMLLGFFVPFALPSSLMLTYKMVNTLDSMVGYRTARYLHFGRWSAWQDDLWGYIPARLTAVLMLCSVGKPRLWSFVRRYGRAHLSPNSGYPEAAMAGILDCRFGGSHDYFGQAIEKPYIGTTDREVGMSDFLRASAIALRVERLMLCVLFSFCVLGGLILL